MSRLTRRDFLATTSIGACGVAVAASGCGALSAFTNEPELRLSPPMRRTKDPIHHLLDRAAFGPRPGDVERITKMGATRWIDEQLDPDAIDDFDSELRTASIDAMWMPADLAFEIRPEDVESQLVTDMLLRAVGSRRQLREVMVSFWLDHFNVAITKSLCGHLEASYVRDAIRPYALGRFRDLLGAVTTSAAMLVYLDGRANVGGVASGPGRVPNENQARELLELHTLGVHGGYTQADVMESARALSGWIVDENWAPGRVSFVPERHDDGTKVVLGARIAAHGGARDVDRLLDVLVARRACAEHVATRLCRHLVSDDPPASIVRRAADVFEKSHGDIARTVRCVLTSSELAAATDAKIKRPFRFVASSLRALGAETNGRGRFGDHLLRMGQAPFRWPTPDGYPDRADAWLGTLPARWRFARELATGDLDGATADVERLAAAVASGTVSMKERLPLLAAHLLGRRPLPEEIEPVRAYFGVTGNLRRSVALLLASPAYQRH